MASATLPAALSPNVPGHSNGYVPVFAIGVGSEAFAGKIDNTQIPYRIAKAAGWKVPEGEDK